MAFRRVGKRIKVLTKTKRSGATGERGRRGRQPCFKSLRRGQVHFLYLHG
jgi:hypothetical protein